MKVTIAQWQRHRISQTLWQQSQGHVGFRWFHEQGLPAPFVLDEIVVQVTSEMSEDILQLRLKAAQYDGRLQQVEDFERVRDDYDQSALHIKLILRGQIVAAGRLVFLQGDRGRSEINEALVPLPDSVMGEPHGVEISRICTHPDFRRGHLLTFLLAECAWQAYKGGGLYLLGYCVSSLVPIYVRFAGEVLPFSGHHPLYEGRQSFVVRIDLNKVMRGDSVPFLAWARFMAPRLRGAKVPASKNWSVRIKSQGVRLIQPCLNEVLKFMLYQNA